MFLYLLPGCPAEGLVMVPYNSTRHLYNSQTEEQNNRIVIATMWSLLDQVFVCS